MIINDDDIKKKIEEFDYNIWSMAESFLYEIDNSDEKIESLEETIKIKESAISELEEQVNKLEEQIEVLG